MEETVRVTVPGGEALQQQDELLHRAGYMTQRGLGAVETIRMCRRIEAGMLAAGGCSRVLERVAVGAGGGGGLASR